MLPLLPLPLFLNFCISFAIRITVYTIVVISNKADNIIAIERDWGDARECDCYLTSLKDREIGERKCIKYLFSKKTLRFYNDNTKEVVNYGWEAYLSKEYLEEEAKKQCDFLIVGLQTDPTIDRANTKNKPVQGVFERWAQLKACKFIDQIVPYSTERELRDILLSFPINVRILGEEYKGKEFTGHDIPMEFYFNQRKHSFSTSELRQRVIEANK